jgi:DNA (cytosine-5)-methyltransferase 1
VRGFELVRPTAVDLFCGAGGMSLGLSRAGFELLLGVDADPACVKTIQANPRHLDHQVVQTRVEDLGSAGVLELTGLRPGELDLLAGGPPCQGFSWQRTVGGDFDDRNDLALSWAGFVEALHPRLAMMENVPAITGRRGAPTLAAVVQRLLAAGYSVEHRVLDAAEFGVPQRRRRFVLVAWRSDGGIRPFCWPDPLPAPPTTVRQAIAHLPSPPADGSELPGWPNHRADRLSPINLERIRALGPGQGREHLPARLLAPCHRLPAERIGHRGVYGRMAWDEPAPTITARFDSFTRGRFGHPDQDRTISLREGAILQGFPADYVFVGSKVEVARQIGNAVPPPFAAALGKALAKTLGGGAA